MAGGIGTRFWPMSRTTKPKQFIDILDDGQTLIQKTFIRLSKIALKENIYVVTNQQYKNLVLEQLPEIKEKQILLEPIRRNTAPCIAYASYKIAKENPNANIVVAPSDHLILKEDDFIETIKIALEASAKNDWLITLGITPSRPDTGYGYTQYNDKAVSDISERIKKVKTFTEKPDLKLAKTFIESGDFLWNSGIFIWSIKSIITAFKSHLPEMNIIFKGAEHYFNTSKEKEYINNIFPTCQNISIDYGIMEKAKNVYVITSDFGWSDLGTWGSLYSNLPKNKDKNSVIGKNVLMFDSKNCIVNMPKDKLVVLQGLDNYIVVESDGILLVCKKSDEQQIKQFVNNVYMNKGEEYI